VTVTTRADDPMTSGEGGPPGLAGIAASAAPLRDRAGALLRELRPLVPYDGAWIAGADPATSTYTALASVDLDGATLQHLSKELTTRTECIVPAGYHAGVGVALFAADGRHVGLLGLLFAGGDRPTPNTRRRLDRLSSVVAYGVDPLRSLRVTAQLAHGATAGAVLRTDGATQPLPGLAGHALLDEGSPVLVVARKALGAGEVHRTFLWPVGGCDAPGDHVRVTVLATTEDAPDTILGMAMLSPAPSRRGLTPRELEVLGLIVDGRSNREIARTLVVAPRTVAAHLEHILVKLGVQTRTAAAVRAEREGLFVPSPEEVAVSAPDEEISADDRQDDPLPAPVGLDERGRSEAAARRAS
jgi:DNA-binding CsgD family transcriptional regulator